MNNVKSLAFSLRVTPCTPWLIFLLFLFPALLPAQTAAEVETLLDQKAVTCAQAAYFVIATALDQPPQNVNEAYSLAMDRGWLPEKAQSGSPVTMSGLSLLMMNAFDIKGGLMYRITKSQRYAYREMIDRGFITGRAYPTLAVSGEQFLQILENVAAEVEEMR